LDEVKEEYRNDCVTALNKFIRLFPQTEVAVCSRVSDYEALTEHLQISVALCLQPLSSEQIYQFLEDIGGTLVGLEKILKSDPELETFAKTPLILYFMGVAYQGWSEEELSTSLCSTPVLRQQHLFDTYINCRLEQGATSEYPKDQVLRWLSWLAERMVQEKRTIFLIEKMQPTWLKNRSDEKVYRIRNFLIAGLVGGMTGLTLGLLCGLLFFINGGKNGLPMGLRSGSGNGLAVGLISGLLVCWPRYISPLEHINWSWQRAKSKLVLDVFMGNILGFMGGIIYGFIGRFPFGLKVWLPYGLIYMLLGGLTLGFSSGLGSSKIEQRIVPNQGIQSSLRNSLRVGLRLGLTVWLTIGVLVGSMYVLKGSVIDESILKIIFGIYFELIEEKDFDLQGGLFFGLIIAPDVGLVFALLGGLKYGGAACIQHFTLRRMLFKKGRIPWNYAKFLDFASERLLMKKVGGGYVFFHRMLLEHFAALNPQPLLPNLGEGEPDSAQSRSLKSGRGI
jgi:hypothetical protein